MGIFKLSSYLLKLPTLMSTSRTRMKILLFTLPAGEYPIHVHVISFFQASNTNNKGRTIILIIYNKYKCKSKSTSGLENKTSVNGLDHVYMFYKRDIYNIIYISPYTGHVSIFPYTGHVFISPYTNATKTSK